MKKFILLAFALTISIGGLYAQISVSGKVTSSEDGSPVPFANVVVKGTTNLAVTDDNGEYIISNVPSDGILVFSSVGFLDLEEHVAGRDRIDARLHVETNILDEVMVVAYGTAKKSAFTGSASVVSSDEINKIQSSNAINALNGKTSGVQMNTSSGQPGATTPSIRIRGISSINAGKDPLVILDGIPYDGDLNNISNQDIESMTVLKDAASSALYGARGANGVIIITTKKGNAGQAKITVDAKWGVNSRATQDYNYIDSPAQYYEMYYGALKSYFMNSQGMSAAEAHAMANNNLTANNDYGLGYNVYNVPAGQYMIGENGKLNPNATLGNVVSYKGQNYLLLPDDWTDAAYTTGLRQEYTVTANAGSDKSSFYASFNYLSNEGIANNSDYERLTGRLKADYQIKDWLKIGANMAYTHYDSNQLGSDGASNDSGNVFALTKMAPIYPLYLRDENGNIMKDDNGILRYDYGDGSNAGNSRPYMGQSNALSSSILDVMNAEGNAINAVGFFEVRFLKDFKFTSTNSVYVDEMRQTNVTNPYYGQYASQNGMVYKYHTRNLAYNFQQLLNWKKSFDVHNLEVMLGHESYRYKYYYLYANKNNMFDPNNTELIGAILDGSANSYTSDYNTEGYFGRVQYDYAEKYFVSGSYRRDASSRFHPDNRWGNFWSFGGAWLLSKEDWFDVNWIDELKIKASYGSQGNDNIGNYRYVTTYEIVNSNGNPAAVPNSMGNKNITWETNGNFNAGVDFSFFKNRLSGTVEFFNRKTTDMLFSFPLPPTMGFTSYYSNVGDMRNMGVELELEGKIFKTRDFEWGVNLNLTHYKNKITYLAPQSKTKVVEGVPGYTSGSYFYGEGEPLYTFYLYKYAGVDENGESLFYKDVLDENKNVIGRETTNKPSEATQYLCGTALPDVYGGFSTQLKYKGFDLSIDFAYQIGGQVYDSDYASAMSCSKGQAFHADLLNAWTPEHHTNIPRFQYNDTYMGQTSDRFLTDASYLSLQNINFGYELPSRVCRSMGMEKLRIYMACDNVWLWSKRQGMDPRQSITGSVTSTYYAPIRTISGGFTLTF